MSSDGESNALPCKQRVSSRRSQAAASSHSCTTIRRLAPSAQGLGRTSHKAGANEVHHADHHCDDLRKQGGVLLLAASGVHCTCRRAFAPHRSAAQTPGWSQAETACPRRGTRPPSRRTCTGRSCKASSWGRVSSHTSAEGAVALPPTHKYLRMTSRYMSATSTEMTPAALWGKARLPRGSCVGVLASGGHVTHRM